MGSILLPLAILSSPAAAQTPEPEKSKPPVWAITCSGVGSDAALGCKMSMDLFVQQTGKRILKVAVERPAGGDAASILFVLPHGLYLPAGVVISVDGGDPRPLVIQTSDESGVYAGTALDGALLPAVQRGNILMVSMTATDKKEFKVPVTLAGFSAAYAHIAMPR